MQLLQMIRNRIKFLRDKDKVNSNTVLMDELESIHQQIKETQIYFDILTNQDLIESCIFQMEALEVKYNYLMKQARERGIRYNAYIDIKEVENINGASNGLDCTDSVSSNHVAVLQAKRETG